MNVVGKSTPIHDSKKKAAGRAVYAADLSLPGMAHVCVIHSTIPHGRVISINTDRAMALPGVYGIYHCLNTPDTKFNHYRSNALQPDLKGEERVFNEHVRFIGDRVGAVAAVDIDTARKAAALVDIEYEPLPHTIGFDDTLKGGNVASGESPIIDDFTKEVGQAPGDISDLIETITDCEFPRITHATMETHVCVADYEAYEDKLTLYSPNQSVHGIRLVVADYLGMPYHKVRVVKTTMGGSFGAKQEWLLEPVAALMARCCKRPVKLVYDRSEAIGCTVVRGTMRGHIRSLFSKDGLLKSLEMDIIMDAGAYKGSSGDYIRALSGKPFRTYIIPHFKYHGRLISSNTPSSGAFRSWSAAEEAIFMEHHLDKVAHALNMDRAALRLLNAHNPGDVDPNNKVPMEDIRIRDTINCGLELFSWDSLLKADKEFNAGNERYKRGTGIGCGGHGNTYYPRFNDYGEGRISLNEDGTIQALLTLHDHGCGTVTAMGMIIGEVLGVPLENISVSEGDTACTPVDFGCFASRTTYVLGKVAHELAVDLKEKIFDCVVRVHNVDRKGLYIEDSRVLSKNHRDLDLPLSRVARESMKELKRNLSADTQFNNLSNPGVTGAHFAHVEVDTYTGFTKILDYLAVHDIGQPINPAMCVAQIQGAVQMGAGAALREKIEITPDGRYTDSLSKYHVFLAPDLPDIRVEFITDGKSEDGPFGAKSIGEVSLVPVAPAIMSAVNAALGTHISNLPYDPDRIIKELYDTGDN